MEFDKDTLTALNHLDISTGESNRSDPLVIELVLAASEYLDLDIFNDEDVRLRLQTAIDNVRERYPHIQEKI